MKTIKAIAIMLLAFGGGLALWAIGSRISVDAAAMGIGLIFGSLVGGMAGMPVGWRLARNQAQRGGFDEGFDAGRREAHREMLEYEGQKLLRQADAAALRVVTPAPQYTIARPFAALTEALDCIITRPPALVVGEIVDNPTGEVMG